MLSKELVSKIKSEIIYIGILFVVGLIIFKIAFYKENFLIILRTVFGFFWLFILPGFFIMYYWHEKLDFVGRFVIGIALGVALIGISSYYLGLLGLHLKYHAIVLPLFYLIIGVILLFRK